MPIISGVGVSEATKYKQEHFRTIVKTHLQATCYGILPNAMRHRWSEPRYYYFDLNSGPGVVDGEDGSPLIFLDEASNYPQMKFKCVLIENNTDNFMQLKENIDARFYPKNIEIIMCYGDNKEELQRFNYVNNTINRQCFGLLYSDPNGTFPDIDLLSDITNNPRFAKLDIVMNLAATSIKRLSKCGKVKETRDLKECLSSLNKSHFIIREPYLKHQWTMIIATNWNSFPKFKKQGFHELNSEIGQSLLNLFNYTADEIKENDYQIWRKDVENSILENRLPIATSIKSRDIRRYQQSGLRFFGQHQEAGDTRSNPSYA